ncbi:MAG: tetratricopeptide repeat protein, partial [Nitrospira sp.]|nr:tetratricopeptide repeat protein [Nitrospira sp.]
AQQHLEALLQVVPTHFESLWTLFRLQLAQRHWSQSEQTIVRLQQAGASGYQINLATGLLAAGREQWEVAAQAFARAQQANAQALPPLAALVNVFLQRQQPEQAMQYLQSMLAAHPDHPFAWGLLGAVFVQLRDMSSALSAYRQQTEVNPAWVEPWRDWAMVEWSQGQKAEAITILNRGLSTHPQSLILLSPLATFYQAEGQVDLAMRQYELILAQSSTDLVAANNLAYLLADKKG